MHQPISIASRYLCYWFGYFLWWDSFTFKMADYDQIQIAKQLKWRFIWQIQPLTDKTRNVYTVLLLLFQWRVGFKKKTQILSNLFSWKSKNTSNMNHHEVSTPTCPYKMVCGEGHPWELWACSFSWPKWQDSNFPSKMKRRTFWRCSNEKTHESWKDNFEIRGRSGFSEWWISL